MVSLITGGLRSRPSEFRRSDFPGMAGEKGRFDLMAPFATFAALVQVIYCAILIGDGRPFIISPRLLISVVIVILAEQFYMWAKSKKKPKK